MKIRIFIALLACCLLLCGCSGKETSATPETSAPEETGAPTTAPDVPVLDENGVPSLTVDDGTELTIPEFIWNEEGGIDLPIDEFDPADDPEVVTIGTVPPTTTADPSAEDEVPTTTTAPPPETYYPGDILPEDVWEDE